MTLETFSKKQTKFLLFFIPQQTPIFFLLVYAKYVNFTSLPLEKREINAYVSMTEMRTQTICKVCHPT